MQPNVNIRTAGDPLLASAKNCLDMSSRKAMKTTSSRKT